MMIKNKNNISSYTKKEPLFGFVKRGAPTGIKTMLFYSAAVISAVVAGGIFVLLMGVNPFNFYTTVITGCFKSQLSFAALVRIVVPLLITSLGVSVAFRMKFWNIGAEGQFIMGAVGASFVALNFGDKLPHIICIFLMAAAAVFTAGLWGFIPAILKCKLGTNETLLTLMLNYIALYIIQYLRDGPWRDPAAGGFPKIAKFPKNAWIDQIFKLDVSFIAAILFVVFIYVYLKYTKQGYEISVIGDSLDTARYAGMNTTKIIIRTMIISAAISGIAGMFQVAGDATSHTLSMGIASGVGFTAIIVSWLAKLNPAGIFAVSFMFGVLEKGCGVAESTFNISSSVSSILQGIILFVVLGADFFIRYKIVLRGGKKNRI